MFKKPGKKITLKIGIHGRSGSGKTLSALKIASRLGRTAVIDTNHGTDFYTHRFSFDVLYTASIDTAVSALDSPGIAEYDVLIVDTITDLWESAKEIAFDGSVNWQTARIVYSKLLRSLNALPLHVIICADSAGDRMRAGPSTESSLHIILKLEDGAVMVEKDRSGLLKSLKDPTDVLKILHQNGIDEIVENYSKKFGIPVDEVIESIKAKYGVESLGELSTEDIKSIERDMGWTNS